MEMVHFIPPAKRRDTLSAAQADNAAVVIVGASGTGKGAIARWIHSNSQRATRGFVVARLSPKGTPLPPQVEQAQGGTLFITEICKLPPKDQRVCVDLLTTKTIQQALSDSPAENSAESAAGVYIAKIANVRLILATEKNLHDAAELGLIIPELYEVLTQPSATTPVFTIEMPTLAERMDASLSEFEDIVLGLFSEVTRSLHKDHLRGLTSEAWSVLKEYDWPGNIRELRNVLHIAVLTATGDRIEEEDIPDFGYDQTEFLGTRDEFDSYLKSSDAAANLATLTRKPKDAGAQKEDTC